MALGACTTENGSARIASGTALAVRAVVTRDIMGVHRTLAHPRDIMRKTAEVIGVETAGEWGACDAAGSGDLGEKPKGGGPGPQVSVWELQQEQRPTAEVIGIETAGQCGACDAAGSGDLGEKPKGDGPIVEGGFPQVGVRELQQEQQPALAELEREEQPVLSEYEEEE